MSPARHTVVLLAPTTTYRGEDFLAAADRLGVDVIQGSDRCHVLAEQWQEGAIPLRFDEPEASARQILEAVSDRDIAAVIGTDERTVLIAAIAARALGLRHNPVEAALAVRDKHRMRERLLRTIRSFAEARWKGAIAEPGTLYRRTDTPNVKG